MTTLRRKIAVIGSGSAGLWLARELAVTHHLRPIVIDEEPFAKYASTKNQGWLQSGAFYIANGQIDVAGDCQLGYDAIAQFAEQHAPAALPSSVSCSMLFESETARDEFLTQCVQAGINASVLPIEELEEREPLAKGTVLRFAAETVDRTVNNQALLSAVLEDARDHGASFLPAERVRDVRLESLERFWKVGVGETVVECEVLVLACGALIPEMLSKVDERLSREFEISKVAVLSLHGQLTNGLLITPGTDLGPNVVPFPFSEPRGITVCLKGADTLVESHEDLDLANEEIRRLLFNLHFHFPHIAEVVQRQEIGMFCYCCQKLQVAGVDPASGQHRRRHILIDYSLPERGSVEGLVALYSGKSTAAPVAAIECAALIAAKLATESVTNDDFVDPVPDIAVQEFLSTPMHRLRWNGTELHGGTE